MGRAGCFICIDAMIDRIKHENSIDVYGQVTCMRAERNYMVRETLLHSSIDHLSETVKNLVIACLIIMTIQTGCIFLDLDITY